MMQIRRLRARLMIQVASSIRLRLALICLAIAWMPVSRVIAASSSLPPEIYSLTPNEGKAGEQITVKGAELNSTQHVYFCAEEVVREAKFKIISRDELRVTAPPFYREGVAATLVVQTARGLTVGVPASALTVDSAFSERGKQATFFRVVKNGYLESYKGVTLIEGGGAAEAPYRAGVILVKNGGKLLKTERYRGVSFTSPGRSSRAASRSVRKNPMRGSFRRRS